MLIQAPTIAELGSRLGLPRGALEATVERFNANAARGEDPAFGPRAIRHMIATMAIRKCSPIRICIAQQGTVLCHGIYPGDIGTKGGILTNANAQALHTDGSPVAGLYAIGNTAASVMGGAYPGAGATLGPAMTFGYVAARHALRVNE